VRQLTILDAISNSVGHLSAVSASPAVITDSGLQGEFARAERELRELEVALGEAEEGIRAFRELEGNAASHQDIEALSTLRSQTNGLVDTLAPVNAAAGHGASLFTSGESTRELVKSGLIVRQRGSPDPGYRAQPNLYVRAYSIVRCIARA